MLRHVRSRHDVNRAHQAKSDEPVKAGYPDGHSLSLIIKMITVITLYYPHVCVSRKGSHLKPSTMEGILFLIKTCRGKKPLVPYTATFTLPLYALGVLSCIFEVAAGKKGLW